MGNAERKSTEILNNQWNKLIVGIFMAMIALLYLSFLLLSDGIENRNQYYEYKDKVIPITATVSEVYQRDYNLSVSVSYEYNDKQYENVYWKQTTDIYEIGETVEIKILPEDPSYVFSEDDGTSDFIKAGIMFPISSAIIIAVVVHFVKKKRKKTPDTPLN